MQVYTPCTHTQQAERLAAIPNCKHEVHTACARVQPSPSHHPQENRHDVHIVAKPSAESTASAWHPFAVQKHQLCGDLRAATCGSYCLLQLLI